MSESELERVVRTTAAGKDYGITRAGFVPKPVARLLEEKVAAARQLFGASVDLTSGSALRSLLELVAVEEARTWAAKVAEGCGWPQEVREVT